MHPESPSEAFPPGSADPHDGRPAPGLPGDDDLEETPLDPAASLALVEAQRRAVRRVVEPDNRLLFGVWGVAWLLGNLLLWMSRPAVDARPEPWAFVCYSLLIAGAVAVTMVHTISRGRGVSGPGATAGAMYGWAWTIGFAALTLIMVGLQRAGLDGEVLGLAWFSLPSLLVGLLYLAGGAMWLARELYLLGAWILLVGSAATLVGFPGTYLVLAFAGGGGFLLMAVVEHLRGRR